MNKKYLIYTVVFGFLTTSSISFSMHNMPKIIYYGSRVVASAAVPVFVMKGLYEGGKRMEEDVAALPDVNSKDLIVQKWAQDIMEKSSDYQDDICLKYAEQWKSCSIKGKKYIMMPFIESILLESALKQQNNAKRFEKMTFFEKFKENFFRPSDTETLISMENYDQYIDQSSMLLKHELGHIVSQDSQNARRMLLAIPIAVEGMCLGVTYNFNKLCKISPPTTLMKSLGRSAVAFAGILPKGLCILPIHNVYSRYREAEADKFACENAANKNELKAFYNIWKDEEALLEKNFRLKLGEQQNITQDMLRAEFAKNGSTHPYPADRAKMIQEEYIDTWDAKHPEDKQ